MADRPTRSRNRNQKKAAENSARPSGGKASNTSLGTSPVSASMMLLTGVWLVGMSIVLIIAIVQLWLPAEMPKDAKSPLLRTDFLVWTLQVSDEARLILIVAMAGALGTQIRSIRSFAWYVGNRKFTESWLPFYFLTPFVGATLALVFYFVIRAGFFAADANSDQLSVYGFAGMAGLVGIFSDQAILRLKEVAEVVFKKPPVGQDSNPQE